VIDPMSVAIKVIFEEGRAINNLIEKIGPEFEQALTLIDCCEGQVIVSGMGKSGYIARKIAATFVSVGIPAYYVHPGEALHGDLCAMSYKDVMLIISNSGETKEILRMLEIVLISKIPIIAILGRIHSAVGQIADIILDASIKKEADPFNLIPTSSTTAALVLGDALAVALMELRGFEEDDFALYHPGGSDEMKIG